jgi:ubiquinone/menaquinone biosynthesis C-methylase UbiE
MEEQKLKTKEDYSIISKMYAKDLGSIRDHFDFIDQAIGSLKEKNLLSFPCVDLGCGSGTVTDYLVEKGLSNIISVDFVPEFCKMVKNKHDKNVKVICGDMMETVNEFKKSSICCYFANYSIIHVPDKEIDELFKKMVQTLVPGGLCMISCSKGNSKGMEQEPYQTQKDPRLTKKQTLSVYMNYFTENEIKERLIKSGMKIVRFEVFEDKKMSGKFFVPRIWILTEK